MLNGGPFQNPAPWTGFSAEIPHGKLGKVYKVIRDFKDTVYPFFESDTLFLECFVLFLVVERFFESRVFSNSILGIPQVTVRKWAGPIEHKEYPEEFPRGIPVLTDRRLASAAEQERSQTEFLIAVVLDGAPVPFGEVKLPREGLEKVADLVSELCWLGQYLVAAALGAAALGLPAPFAALSPVVSALALAVQFCAILGGSDYVPPHFRSLFEPLAWVVPHAPGAALAWSLEALAAVNSVKHIEILKDIADSYFNVETNKNTKFLENSITQLPEGARRRPRGARRRRGRLPPPQRQGLCEGVRATQVRACDDRA